MIQPVRQRALGGMRKDIDPQDLNKGHYPDALNVRKQGTTDGKRADVQPILGNEYAFELPSIVAQDKVYRIYPTPNANPDLYGLYFYDETGLQIGSIVTFTSGANLAAALYNCGNAIDTALSSYCTATVVSDYVEVVFDTLNSQYLDYKIVSAYNIDRFGTTYSALNLEVYEEAYNLVDEGPTYCIGSYDLMGDLFIMSANTAGTVGVISVAQRDIDGLWTIVKLLQSSELNFSLEHLIDLRVEKNAFQTSLYWTDDYNTPRGMYYRLPTYVTDGFLAINGGIYNYDSIDLETQLTNQNINVRLAGSQLQTGGYLFSGNYRYAVRLYDESLVPTEWSYLSGILPVYVEDTADGNAIYGATANGFCPKINVINVFGINKKIYKYIDLAAVQYTDNAVTGYIVDRFSLDDDGLVTIDLQHTGYETNQQTLDLAELTTIKRNIKKAKNIELMDNRLILSNLETDYDKDLEAFAQAIEYSIQRENIGKLPYITNPLSLLGAAEYQNISNTYYYIGYMINETYRFGVRVKWKNGGWSKAYWVDDITIDLTTGGRKLSGVSDLNITDAGGDVYSYYVRFENVDTSLLPVGIEIEDIEFVRAECIEEVLMCGNAVHTGNDTQEFLDTFNLGAGNAPASTTAARIYFPDYFLNKVTDIIKQNGDELVCFPTPGFVSNFPIDPDVSGRQYNGVWGSSTPTVIDSFDIYEETDATNKFKFIRVDITGGQNLPTAAVYGLTYVQYKRPITNKYGDIYSTEYITTGCLSDGIKNVSTSTQFNCFGGDTFNQKTLLKSVNYPGLGGNDTGCMYVYSQNRVNANLKSGESDVALFPGPEVNTFALLVDALEFPAYYAMTYNQQYNVKNVVQNWLSYNAEIPELGDFPNQITWSELKSYNQIKDSYRDIPQLNFKDLDLSNGEINAMLNVNGSLMTWQPRKFNLNYFSSNNMISTTDGQEILVGDSGVMARKPNELSVYGTYHKWSVIKGRTKGGKDSVYWANSEYRKIMRFGSDGTIVLSDDKNNKVFFYDLLKQLHEPNNPNYDNPVYLAGITGVFDERFSDVKFTFIIPSIAPNFLYKTVIFNEEDNEFLFLETSVPKIYLKYSDSYLTPSMLMDGNYLYLEEEKIYDHSVGTELQWYCTLGDSGVTTIDWTQGSTTITCDTDFNILFNKFGYPFLNYFVQIGTSWYQVLSIDSLFEATLIEPVAEASGSSDTVPYKYCISEEGYIEQVVNQDPNTSKRFIATQWATDLAPWKVVYKTDVHQTTQLREEFETREDFHYCTIYNDELTTGLKTSDTTQLFGRWIKVKMKFKIGEYNKMYNFIVTLYNRFRQYIK